MKLPLFRAFVTAQLLGATLVCGKLPVADFVQPPAVPLIVLAPDGQATAYFEQQDQMQRLILVDFPTGTRRVLEINEGRKVSSQQAVCFWVNNQRLMYAGGDYLFAALDRNGQKHVPMLGGPGPLIHLFRDEKEGWLLTEGYESLMPEKRAIELPFVLKINARTGITVREMENPGNVTTWFADPQGVITAAVERREKSGRTRVIYRASETSAWKPLPGLGWDDPSAEPLGFSPNAARLYLTRVTEGGTWGIYAYDLAQQALGAPVLVDPRYDIRPSSLQVFARSYPSNAVIFSPVDHTVLGIRYNTEFPRVHWFEPELGAIQQEIDAVLPGKVNSIVSQSDDRQRLVVLSWTAGDPGTYYLFDRRSGTGDLLVNRMPWVDPKKMAETQAMRFRSRDGVDIDGYLTMPRERKGRPLPLVALIQTGPGQREFWEYDPLVQFLADRGYAVLRVNGRGSSGFGPAFALAGRLDRGMMPITDVADAIQWTINRGITDPARVAVVGTNSFGGYAALMLAATEPSLVRAVAAIGPFIDWTEGGRLKKLDRDYAEFFQSWIAGETQPDDATLRQLSPAYHVAHINAAVLLIHDKSWGRYSFGRTKNLADELAKRGRQVKFLSNLDGTSDSREFIRRQFEAIEALLSGHLIPSP